MYLKSLEVVGFKSFASRTKLRFEPGMTAIVGPNGCGKSNVSDAVRWVLGEQSAKALRGNKMEDCIFNGTDTRKPLGMAEVSITFSDCDGVLETEYNEVTVTRRVFRSGEGQYFLNKTPCRLKDIQRLFMGTGVGTTSYSLMEQGRIDRVLSARPEDRRAVFEEASGITRFKADKKEAIHKLEQTEANLLRLSDVIREVKRQIGSLQRQAGKARRYKAYRDELRGLDLFVTNRRLKEANSEIRRVEAKIGELGLALEASQNEVREVEQGNARLRESLVQTEREIGTTMEASVQAQSRLDHTRELIRMNRQRIDEYRVLTERDVREIDTLREQIAQRRRVMENQTAEIEAADGQRLKADAELKKATAVLDQHEAGTSALRARVESLREEAVELESTASHLQNELIELESRERSTVVQRERLTAEKAQLARVVAAYESRQQTAAGELEAMQKAVQDCDEAVARLSQEKADKERSLAGQREEVAARQSEAAARRAQIELLREDEAAGSDFPGGARVLLDADRPLDLDRSRILGALAAHVEAEREFTSALEAALRAWLDAVLIADSETARVVLCRLEALRAGPARMLVADAGAARPLPPLPAGAIRLADHVRCADAVRPLMQTLIGNVLVVAAPEALPAVPDPVWAYVTRGGSLIRENGVMEFWMAEPGNANPLSRKHMLSDSRKQLQAAEAELGRNRQAVAALTEGIGRLETAIRDSRIRTDQVKRGAAQKEGESLVVAKEAAEARQRLETVTWELDELNSRKSTGEEERQAVVRSIAEVQDRRDRALRDMRAGGKDLEKLEAERSSIQSDATECRIRFAGLDQKVEHLRSEHTAVRLRVAEMEAALEGRSEGVRSYAASVDALEDEVAASEETLAALEEAATRHRHKAASLRKNREHQSQELKAMEAALSEKRDNLEKVREEKSNLELRRSECRMRRQNQIDRVTSDYGVSFDELIATPPPAWPAGEPPMEQIETQVAELKTKLEAMGPVNLVAIEEYQELQERADFLTAQEEDLTKSKQQLMDMIRKINKTTSEMFQSTFDQANQNFQEMFTKLFNGGAAKLVLVDDEDVLECGVEIIARPPGKRLQNVSLLSGGERTLTAVALLFAIYMIRPSPFCMLDELDAALDESNIGRFVGVLQGFLNQSQFVVITHSRQTIAAADILYGVTMPERGISDIVSMKFKEAEAVAAT